MRHTGILLAALMIAGGVHAQYAPQALVAGSTAIHKSSPLFSAWATGCHVQRGLQQINDASFGYASLGDSTAGTGNPDGNVVSLGDSGIAVLTFNAPIFNGPGFDFAVFENGFPNVADPEEAFLELAFVEVSSDGLHFTRFPSASYTQDTAQLSSVAAPSYTNARHLNNLAGKYISSYGTPFDLQELAGSPGLDVDNITHIRLVDAIGSIGVNGSRDASGRPINDPFPTPFPGSGFDLDAVGVLQGAPTTVLPGMELEELKIFPNPATDALQIRFSGQSGKADIVLRDVTGRVLTTQHSESWQATIPLGHLTPGGYFITIHLSNGTTCTRAFLHR